MADKDRPSDAKTQVRARKPAAPPATPAGKRRVKTPDQESLAQRKRGARTARDERHLAELVALACFGLTVFLTYVLATGGGGGFLGRVADDVLRASFGLLAYLVPAALLAATGCILLQYSPRWVSAWLLGGVLLLLSLFLLVESGFPPLGPDHGLQTFAPAVYQARAGWLGEVWYVGVLRLTGSVGVALIGWLGLLAGISLVTGLTVRRMVEHTGRAAGAVRAGAEEQTRRFRDRGDEADRPGPLDPYLQGFGPAEVSWDFESDEATLVGGAGVGTAAIADTRPVLDGASEYPDLYGDEDPRARGGDGVHDGGPATGELSSLPSTAHRDAADADESEPTRVNRRALPSDGHAMPEAGQLALLGADGGVAPYLLPNADLLKKSAAPERTDARGDRETADLLVATLADFGVVASVVGMVVGPRVTRYELQLAPGTKVSKVAGLKDDLAYALASTEIRILAPIPGKQAVGVEVPNRRPSFVTLGDIYRDFPKTAGPLMVWLGKDISGKPVYADLAKMPHLLIAGTTGSGKSGCVNCIISWSCCGRRRPRSR